MLSVQSRINFSNVEKFLSNFFELWTKVALMGENENTNKIAPKLVEQQEGDET